MRRLVGIKRRIEQQREADRRRTEPVCKQLLERAFAELGLDDPEHTFIPAIARSGISAALESVAIFRAKRAAGATFECHERYLLGIAHNVARRDEDLAAYEHLVELRLRANDLLLQPLRLQEESWRGELGTCSYLDATLEAALASSATVDRAFWRARFLVAVEAAHDHQRQRHIALAVRLVATSYGTPRPSATPSSHDSPTSRQAVRLRSPTISRGTPPYRPTH